MVQEMLPCPTWLKRANAVANHEVGWAHKLRCCTYRELHKQGSTYESFWGGRCQVCSAAFVRSARRHIGAWEYRAREMLRGFPACCCDVRILCRKVVR